MDQAFIYGDFYDRSMAYLEAKKYLVFNGVSPSIDSWRRGFLSDLNLLVHRTKQQIHPYITYLV
jgi:hypothetical protein